MGALQRQHFQKFAVKTECVGKFCHWSGLLKSRNQLNWQAQNVRVSWDKGQEIFFLMYLTMKTWFNFFCVLLFILQLLQFGLTRVWYIIKTNPYIIPYYSLSFRIAWFWHLIFAVNSYWNLWKVTEGEF